MPVLKTYLGGQWVDVGGGAGGLTNPMTTAGDMIYGGTSGAPTRLAKGADGQVLTLASGLPSWAAASGGGAIDWANPISVTGATTLTIGRHHVCSGTTADYTVTLPAVSGNAGKLLSVEMSVALTKLVTVDGNASETIDGATSRVMWARETAVLLCDGTQWTKVGGKSIPMVGRMLKTGDQLFNELTITLITYDSVAISSPVVDLANSQFIIRRGGLYQVASTLKFSNAKTTTGYVQTRIHKGGNVQFLSATPYVASNLTTAHLAFIETYVATDTVQNYGFFTGGSFPTTVTANTPDFILNEVSQW